MLRKVFVCIAFVAVAFGVVLSFVVNHSYVTTPSMYPTIPPGSEMFVSAKQDYHVGDVIEFRANGLTWVHRLVKINPDGSYVTKGDNPENAPDIFEPAVTKADVIGSVDHSVPGIGFPELILHHPSYGLAWLRTELGLTGRILLVTLFTLTTFLLAYPPSLRLPGVGRRWRPRFDRISWT